MFKLKLTWVLCKCLEKHYLENTSKEKRHPKFFITRHNFKFYLYITLCWFWEMHWALLSLFCEIRSSVARNLSWGQVCHDVCAWTLKCLSLNTFIVVFDTQCVDCNHKSVVGPKIRKKHSNRDGLGHEQNPWEDGLWPHGSWGTTAPSVMQPQWPWVIHVFSRLIVTADSISFYGYRLFSRQAWQPQGSVQNQCFMLCNLLID